jgi:hypothetical protein
MKRIAVCIAVLVLSPSAAGQQPCDPETDSNCTVGGALVFYRADANDDAIEEAKEEVVNTNRPTTSPDAFAGRVHNSYQDFLNLLSFAVNEVDEAEDGESLVVRFNPVRRSNHLLGLTLTIAKPSIADALGAKIPEASRAATVALLDEQLSDTDDQTWSASYSFASTTCAWNTRRNAACWGRKPSTYDEILTRLLPAPSEGATQTGESFARIRAFLTGLGSISDMQVQGRPDLIAAIEAHVEVEKKTLADGQTLFKAFHLDLLPTLIDNQPQLTASASYHQRGPLSGPDDRSATVEFHMGRENVNTLRAKCHKQAGDDDALTTCLQRELRALAKRGLSTDKYVATFTYKKSDDYVLTELPLENPVEGFEGLDLPSASEYTLKVQAGRQLGTEVMGKATRADLSFEGIRTEDDGVRTKNRWVGTVTLAIPMGDKITVPVSLTYANKAEFLGDQKERFGAHFGLSYRLPNLFGGSETP